MTRHVLNPILMPSSILNPRRRRGTIPILGAWILTLIPLLTAPPTAFASGSYRHSAIPDKNSDLYNEGIDVGRFELGRKLFAGMIRLAESDTAQESSQSTRLQELSRKIPSSQSRSTERMQRMAGRLSPEQIDALEYFVQERFGQRTLAAQGKRG